MNIGSMRHKIEIQVYADVENEVGETTKTWTTYKKIWSEKKKIKNSNTFEGGKEGIE